MTKKLYQIDGEQFSTLEGFYEQIGAVLVPGVSWEKNLDAFNDILRGGFGTPDDGFILEWRNSEVSRKRLGYDETVRQLEHLQNHCHPANRPHVSAQLQAAKRHEGSTVFDWLVDIIRRHGERGEESRDGVELQLR